MSEKLSKGESSENWDKNKIFSDLMERCSYIERAYTKIEEQLRLDQKMEITQLLESIKDINYADDDESVVIGQLTMLVERLEQRWEVDELDQYILKPDEKVLFLR